MKAQKGGGFMPDMDSVEGQTIQKEIDKLPLVYIREVNEAVKFDGLGLMSIDVHFTHPEYYLFTINREALKTGIIAYFHPDDISKIEESEYKSLKQISPTK